MRVNQSVQMFTIFTPSKNEKRKIRRNADTEFTVTSPMATLEHYELYKRYMEARHPDSHMADRDFDDFRKIALCQDAVAELRLDGKLIACANLKIGQDGITMDYTYFDPELSKRRGLGTYMNIQTYLYTRDELKLDFVYLGFLQSYEQGAKA